MNHIQQTECYWSYVAIYVDDYLLFKSTVYLEDFTFETIYSAIKMPSGWNIGKQLNIRHIIAAAKLHRRIREQHLIIFLRTKINFMFNVKRISEKYETCKMVASGDDAF